METHAELAHRFKQGKSAHNVRAHEHGRVAQRSIVVGLGSKVHNRIRFRIEAFDKRTSGFTISDIANNETHAILGKTLEVCLIPRVRQSIKNCHRIIGVRDDIVHEIRTDESRATGHDQVCSTTHSC